MNCLYCGAGLVPGTFFCPECGRRVSDTGVRPGSGGFVADPIAYAPAPTAAQADWELDGADETASLQLTAPASSPFRLVSTTGQRFEVTGRSLLGRNPSPEPGQRYDSVLVLVDEGKTVSKRHLELVVVADQLLATDLGSGNGTVLEVEGRPPIRLAAGTPQLVPRGCVLRLGKHRISVE